MLLQNVPLAKGVILGMVSGSYYGHFLTNFGLTSLADALKEGKM